MEQIKTERYRYMCYKDTHITKHILLRFVFNIVPFIAIVIE